MKKKLLAIFILITTLSQAQTEKNSYLIGGSAGGQLDLNTISYLAIAPNFGYFILDRFSLGVELGTSYIFHSSGDLRIDERFNYSISPYVRFYTNFNEKGNAFFLEAKVNDNMLQNSNLAIGAAHVWFIKENIGLEAKLLSGTKFSEYKLVLLFGFQFYFSNNK